MAFSIIKPGVVAAGKDPFPVGSIMTFASNTVNPTGRWLLCDGAVLSQTDSRYVRLYQTIQGTYNAGNEGAGNFRIPDLRGRFIRGTDTDGSDGMSPAALGTKQGSSYRSHGHGIASDDTNIGSNYAQFRTGVQICNWTFVSCNPATNYRCPANGGCYCTVNPVGGPTLDARTADETRPHNVAMRWYIKY